MIVATVIAVVIGLAPVNTAAGPQIVNGDYTALVGHYSKSIDRKGTLRVRGFDPRSGAPYDVSIDQQGAVEATVGEQQVSFRVAPAA